MNKYRIEETIRGFAVQELMKEKSRRWFKKVITEKWVSLNGEGRQPTASYMPMVPMPPHIYMPEYYCTLDQATAAVEKFKRFDKGDPIIYPGEISPKIINSKIPCPHCPPAEYFSGNIKGGMDVADPGTERTLFSVSLRKGYDLNDADKAIEQLSKEIMHNVTRELRVTFPGTGSSIGGTASGDIGRGKQSENYKHE